MPPKTGSSKKARGASTAAGASGAGAGTGASGAIRVGDLVRSEGLETYFASTNFASVATLIRYSPGDTLRFLNALVHELSGAPAAEASADVSPAEASAMVVPEQEGKEGLFSRICG